MENKLYLVLNANTKDENDSLILGMNVLLSYLRSDPQAIEWLRLIVLNENRIVIDKPIYEDFNFEIIQTTNDGNLKKSFKTIIDHLNSTSKDKIFPIVICLNLIMPNQDFSEELLELNKMTQGVNLITSFGYLDYYQPYYSEENEFNSSAGFTRLNLIESMDVKLLKDIFSYNYVEQEISTGHENKGFSEELPPPPPEYMDLPSSEKIEFPNLNSMEINTSMQGD